MHEAKSWFRGLIEGRGRVVSLEETPAEDSHTLIINTADWKHRPQSGDNLAVNGVCLTVKETRGTKIVFHLWPATARKTTLLQLQPGDLVNLEQDRMERPEL